MDFHYLQPINFISEQTVCGVYSLFLLYFDLTIRVVGLCVFDFLLIVYILHLIWMEQAIILFHFYFSSSPYSRQFIICHRVTSIKSISMVHMHMTNEWQNQNRKHMFSVHFRLLSSFLSLEIAILYCKRHWNITISIHLQFIFCMQKKNNTMLLLYDEEKKTNHKSRKQSK